MPPVSMQRSTPCMTSKKSEHFLLGLHFVHRSNVACLHLFLTRCVWRFVCQWVGLVEFHLRYPSSCKSTGTNADYETAPRCQNHMNAKHCDILLPSQLNQTRKGHAIKLFENSTWTEKNEHVFHGFNKGVGVLRIKGGLLHVNDTSKLQQIKNATKHVLFLHFILVLYPTFWTHLKSFYFHFPRKPQRSQFRSRARKTALFSLAPHHTASCQFSFFSSAGMRNKSLQSPGNLDKKYNSK